MRSIPALTFAVIFAPAVSAEVANTPRAAQTVPGTVNYVEGTASLSGRSLSYRSVGFAILAANGQLSTRIGKVEILLTPGVFLRLDENSILRMVSPDITHTELALEQGSAEVEVDQLFPQNNLVIDQGSTQTRLQKPGLYEFTADSRTGTQTVRVLDGKAASLLPSGRDVVIKQGHLLDDSGDSTHGSPHLSRFDRNDYSDALTDWNDLRDDYLGQANQPSIGDYTNTEPTYSAGRDGDPSLYGSGSPYDDPRFGYDSFSPFGFDGFGDPYGGGFYGGGLGFGGGFGGGGFGNGFYGGGFGNGFYGGGFGGLYGGGFGNGFYGGGFGGLYGFGNGFYGGGLGGFYGGGIYGGAFNRRGGYSGTFNNTGPHPGTYTTGAFRAGHSGGYHGGGSGLGGGGFHGGMGGGGFHGGGGHR